MKYALGLIAIVVVAGGVYYLSGRTSAETAKSTPTSSDAKETSVLYTNSGFQPGSVEIKAGGTVTFLNQSDKKMWVASDPHPTHTNYPGFDEGMPVAGGGQ